MATAATVQGALHDLLFFTAIQIYATRRLIRLEVSNTDINCTRFHRIKPKISRSASRAGKPW